VLSRSSMRVDLSAYSFFTSKHNMQGNTNVLSYTTGWMANGLSWCNREGAGLRFAVSSYTLDYKNTVDIVEKLDDTLVKRATWEHCYPPTRIMFAPQKANTDLIISTADYLRLWEIKEVPPTAEADKAADAEASDKPLANPNEHIDSEVVMKKVFDGGKPNEFCSPVTGCDWNCDDPKMVGCCSIDTTVAIWDVETAKLTMQLIAHDKDVFDIAFAKGTHTFASCGADGSARLFDLREMEHCTVVYESPHFQPLLRVAWNKLDQTYLAAFGADATEVVIIDIRFPSTPVGTLDNGHTKPINSISWAPNATTHLASAGEDCTANIWDLTDLPNAAPSCRLNFKAENPINNIAWCPRDDQWIAITSGNQASLLHI
jgi:DDB1- and CUL4-associated factor 7